MTGFAVQEKDGKAYATIGGSVYSVNQPDPVTVGLQTPGKYGTHIEVRKVALGATVGVTILNIVSSLVNPAGGLFPVPKGYDYDIVYNGSKPLNDFVRNQSLGHNDTNLGVAVTDPRYAGQNPLVIQQAIDQTKGEFAKANLAQAKTRLQLEQNALENKATTEQTNQAVAALKFQTGQVYAQIAKMEGENLTVNNALGKMPKVATVKKTANYFPVLLVVGLVSLLFWKQT